MPEFWAIVFCFAFSAAPGDDAIRSGSFGGPGAAARFESDGFRVARLAAGNVAWLLGVLP